MHGVAVDGNAGEAELLALMRAGQSSAYVHLMRRHNQRLFRLARGILHNDAEAEEAVQEGYLRAFTHLDGFKGEASLATWLARIVANEALARLRRRRPTIDIEEADALLLTEGERSTARTEPSPEQALARCEIRRAIEAAVDALPAPFRAVFMLRAIEQLSIAETAAYLDIPEETVKTRFHRANRMLRHRLSAAFGSIFDGAFPFLGARCDHLISVVLKRLGLDAEASAAMPPRDRPVSSHPPP
ncbi:MAG TPA: RNA polymerase sigma factor [Stellaceae bacterium]|nr:RNA polymerase sigma factor [Stellaceae bacterium]